MNSLSNGVLGEHFSTLSGSMWWKNEAQAKNQIAYLKFQYPLRVNVVEKPADQLPVLLDQDISVPSPGQCGGKTNG